MGCPASVTIGDNLTFSVVTHDPDSGLAADADAVPTYRVYEDETATPILTGNMAKLDDSNTTGFYSETIACTAGNTFEDGKSYTVYVAATVSSASDAIDFNFKALAQDPTDVYARVGAPAGASVSVDIATIDGNVDSILTDTATDGVVLAADAITSAKFDESTAFPLKSADTGSTLIARTGADSDTLETLSDQIDTLETEADIAAVADAVCDELLSEHTTAGSLSAKLYALSTAPVSISSPVASDGTITTYQGYASVDAGAIVLTDESWAGDDLTGITVCELRMIPTGDYVVNNDDSQKAFAGTLLVSGTSVIATVELTVVQKATLTAVPAGSPANYRYDVKCLSATTGDVVQVFTGWANIFRGVPAVA